MPEFLELYEALHCHAGRSNRHRRPFCHILEPQEVFLNIMSVIQCSLIQNYQLWYSIRTYSQPNHDFLRKLSFLLDSPFLVSFSTVHCPYSVVVRIVDAVNVEPLLVRKQNSHGVFFSIIVSHPIRKFLSLLFVFVSEQRFHYSLVRP